MITYGVLSFSLVKKIKLFFTKGLLFFVLAVILTAATSTTVFKVTYSGRIYPGVTVGKISLSGLPFKESKRIISGAVASLPSSFEFTFGDKRQKVSREQLGVNVNIDKTVEMAMLVGRQGNYLRKIKEILDSANRGTSVPLVLDWDEKIFQKEVSILAADLERLPEDPGVVIDNQLIVINRGRNGEILRRDLLRREIENRLRDFSGESISVKTQSVKVELSDNEVTILKARAEKLLGSSLTLNYPGGTEEKSIVLTDKELVGFLAPEGLMAVDDSKVTNYVATLAESVNKLPENAVFQFVADQGRVTVFKPAKDGIILDRKKTADALSGVVLGMTEGGQKTAALELAVVKTPPLVTTNSVNNLGIKELLGRGISYYSGSIPGRIHNVILGTSRVNGALVAPGEEFSFNKTLGDVSAETGYQQAYVIKAGRTVLGDGGGVCQISTTLFRAILAAGLPVVERWAHAYRVHYYEEKTQVGIDATVYSPSVDFKFKNDTNAYILIQASVDEKAEEVIFELYGTSDGRQATISKTRIWDVTAPPPDLYQDDPTLPAGRVKQIDFSAWGAKTAFDWTVTRGDEILQKKTFYSNYQPWKAIFLKGTKPI